MRELGKNRIYNIFGILTGSSYFTIIEKGTVHNYTVQCVLSLNLFHEIIYVFLWFWIVAVLLPIIVYDVIKWSHIIFLNKKSYPYKFIKLRVKVHNQVNTKYDKYLVRLFAANFIGDNGVFILRLIEHNANASIVSELITELWMNFKKKY